MNIIKASTISVLLDGSPSVGCSVYVNGEHTNLTLRFDRGPKAQLCGYPMTWNIHDVPVDSYDSDSPTGADLFECDGIEDDGQPYISANDEATILGKLKNSLKRQFNDPMFLDHCPESQRLERIQQIDAAIKTLKGACHGT